MGITEDRVAGLELQVHLGREQVRSCAKRAASKSSGWSMRGGVVGRFGVRELRSAERGVTFVVSAPNGRSLLEFRVEDEPSPSGETAVRVRLVNHSEVQSSGPLGIPVDRRRIAGYPAYVKFLQNFAELVHLTDAR